MLVTWLHTPPLWQGMAAHTAESHSIMSCSSSYHKPLYQGQLALHLASHRGPEQRPLGLGQHEAEDAAAEAVVRQREVRVVEDEHVVRGAA